MRINSTHRQVSPQFLLLAAEVIPFQNSHYLVHPLARGNSDLDTMIAMYRQMIPLAVAPSPQCMLKQDLAALYVAAGDFTSAERMAGDAGAQCQRGELAERTRYPLLNEVYQGLIEQYRQSGQMDRLQETEQAARGVAAGLAKLGIREPSAAALLTVKDLIATFDAHEAQVSEATSPIPVQVTRYAMPQDGDWSDALLVHAGASVSFRIVLPQEPTVLSFRAAMDPNTWNWGGDGATFVVLASTDTTKPAELYRKHISDEAADRRWHDESVSLAPYAGQSITLTLATEPGPRLDYTGDSAGWGEPRVILASK